METKRIGDIMIHMDEYPHIRHTSTLIEAIETIENSRIYVFDKKSLPRVLLVLDESARLVGLLRRRDILRGLIPDFLLSKPLEYKKKLFDIKIDPHLSELSFEQLIKGFRERAEKPVSSVMMKDIKTVEYDDLITKVIFRMVSDNVPLHPVLLNDKVVGVVRSVDVFHEVAKYLL